jgi:acylphosphatase
MKNTDPVTALYARVRGRVQGIGFRYSTIRQAHRLGINGWVRNAANGDVEVWAEAEADKLDAFLRWLHRGPELAQVKEVDTEEKLPKGYQDFGVEY